MKPSGYSQSEQSQSASLTVVSRLRRPTTSRQSQSIIPTPHHRHRRVQQSLSLSLQHLLFFFFLSLYLSLFIFFFISFWLYRDPRHSWHISWLTPKQITIVNRPTINVYPRRVASAFSICLVYWTVSLTLTGYICIWIDISRISLLFPSTPMPSSCTSSHLTLCPSVPKKNSV